MVVIGWASRFRSAGAGGVDSGRIVGSRGRCADLLDEQVDRFGGSVAGPLGVEVGQELVTPHGKRAAETGDLGHRAVEIPPHERPDILERVQHCYPRTGTGQRVRDIEYMGYEFTEPDGARLLYIEQRC
jgi:hypothetical protein